MPPQSFYPVPARWIQKEDRGDEGGVKRGERIEGGGGRWDERMEEG